MSLSRILSFLLLTLVLGGCASRPVNPPITQTNPNCGYRFETRQVHAKNKENLVVLAFSGGGTRAAAFSYGVLEFLKRTEVVGLFDGATFGDLDRGTGPLILVSATDISSGTRFTFSQAIFDVICSDLNAFPLSRAGESELTWQAIGGIGYAFKWGQVVAAWRYLDYKFKSGSAIEV